MDTRAIVKIKKGTPLKVFHMRITVSVMKNITEAYSELCQTSKMEVFTKKLCKTLHPRCLTEF